MEHISKSSTHFRVTTDFEKVGVDFRDYLRAKISDIDVLSESLVGTCKKVEYVNIRGIVGVNTEMAVWNKAGSWIFHTDSRHLGCAYNAKQGSVDTENNFGFYCESDISMNTQFRGTANDESTTQYWFGGYL